MDIATTGPTLHDRATRGEPLTEEEQAMLDDWYAGQDAEEAAQLGVSLPALSISDHTVTQPQIDTLLSQIKSTTAQIETLIEQNDRLHRENQVLQQKLARRSRAELA